MRLKEKIITEKKEKFLSCLAVGNSIDKSIDFEELMQKFDLDQTKLSPEEKKNVIAYMETFEKITFPKITIYLEKLMDHVLALCIFGATETVPTKIALSTILSTEFIKLFRKYVDTIQVNDIRQNKENPQTTLALKAIENFFGVFIDSFPKGNDTKEMRNALEDLLNAANFNATESNHASTLIKTE